ncbi:MAG: hypothetical protein H8E86_03970 [Planctomycetes bacterium]|nr:hypothetical protein [Planctomycetota bacterium]
MDDAQKARFWLAVAAVTILNLGIWMFLVTQSGGPTTIRIAHATNATQFEYSGRLEIRFDRNVFEGKVWDEALPESPFLIDPPINGEWIIRGSDTIVFEPSSPPPPGHRYFIHPAEGHRFFDDYAINRTKLPALDYKPLRCEYIRLIDNQKSYAQSNSPSRTATIEIVFNQPVSRVDLLEHLRVESVDQKLEFTHVSEALNRRHRIDVPCNPSDAISVTIAKDLSGHNAPLGLTDDFQKRVMIPTGLHVEKISANSAWRNNEPSINLRFDRYLNQTQSEPSITITPEIGAVRVRTSRNSITLTGAFVRGEQYTVVVAPPLLAKDGSTLLAAVSRTVKIPDQRPMLKFEASSGRLGTKGSFELAVKAYGIQKAKIRMHRLLDRHIPTFLSGVMSNWEVPQLGELVSETNIDIPINPTGATADLALSLDTIIDRVPGVYWVTIESKDSRWTGDSMLLQVGDLGLDIQTDTSGILAWVTQVESGQGAPDVEVVAYSNNRTELVKGTTDDDGLIRLDFNPSQCALITARRENELAFVHVREAKGLDNPTMAGAPWAGPLDIALYADRGVHRPGETIYITGTVRTTNGEVPKSIPLELRMTRPDKRVILTKAVQTDPEQGMFQVDLPTRGDDPTGNWVVTMHLPGDDVAITTIPCPIMAFMPVRLKVEASPINADKPGDVQVGASYLHGAPASGLKTTCSTIFRAVRYTDDRYPEHKFEDPPTMELIKRDTTASLNDKGQFAFNIEIPQLAGTWQGDVETTVIELGGRATTARTRIHRQTAKVHLGLREQNGALHGTDETITIEAVVLDEQGTIQTSIPVKTSLFSVNHSWQLVDVGKGKRKWKSIEITNSVKNVEPAFTVGQDNSLVCTLPPLPMGTYRLVATVAGATLGLDLHVADHEARGRMSADQPDRLELIAEDVKVHPGMHTSVLIRSGFPGTALFTVETDTIKHWELVEITGDGVRVPFVVPESVRDTCFVGATLLRPLNPTRKEWLPLRARGATRLQVDLDAHTLDVQLMGESSARPGDKVSIELYVPPHSSDDSSPTPLVHLWAVDEGALLATDWSVPNLYEHFLQARRRTVAGVGTTEQLLTDFDRPVSTARIGGDAARKFREPVPVRQPKTEVLWRTVHPLPKDGKLQVEMTMPKIDGAMRIMAVVVDGDRYGKSRHLISVQAPLQFVAATPRTAAPGDIMSIPVHLQNNTDTDSIVQLSLTTGKELSGQLSHEQIHLPAHDEVPITLTLTAAAVGSGNLELLATSIDEESTLQSATLSRSIAVRPPHGRERNVYRVRVEPGETVQVKRDRTLEALAGHITIIAGGLPTVDLKPAFDNLVEYPYGCAEQTGSRTEGLLAALTLPESVSGTPHTLLQEWATGGLRRLYWMQRLDGSMPYWQGGKANDWITLRTAIIALKARDQGVDAPEDLLKGLLSYTARIARPSQRKSNVDLAALACRVLARGEMPDKALIATLSSNPTKLTLAGHAHLADACAAIGDLKTAETLVDMFTAPSSLQSDDGGRLTSGVHQCAIALEVLTNIAPEHPIAVELVRYINAARTARGWRTTYENAAAISALSSWHAIQVHDGVAKGNVQIGGKIIDINSNEPVHISFDVEDDATKTETITSTGDGQITVLVSSSGIPTSAHERPIKQDKIQIERTWRDSEGRLIKRGDPVIAGDLITVDLEVHSTSGFAYQNVAIVDVLPGGMEFELPALATSAKRDKTSIVNVDQVEFRDDRLLVFASLDDKPRRLRYLMRAIVPGTWAVPAPDALSMYDPDAHGRGAAGIVEIKLQ